MHFESDGRFTVSRLISCFNIRQSISSQMGSREDLIAVDPQSEDGLWSREFHHWTG